ncbi:hypothetical protein [Mesorhizobium sp. L-8-3]|uniref:hypothetical protein n=1 Tax=Mesorhizobium sp. L-8-3 TaxID=2744522 RepID=UPI0019282867|nr:hypothetical protein [Mesorhizobium sp. L-8-3]BCH26980.1 hypothetical protein MesoLjLb_67650 [Mesorhizobium sp. L-8-3]
MAFQSGPILGILELDEGLLPDSPCRIPRKGSLTDPATFGRLIITHTVEGALAETVIRGDLPLEAACVTAARRLVERGAAMISADCGFFIRHQAAVSAAVNVPVAMSSLLLIPTLLQQLAPAQKPAVITADSRHCSEDLFGIESPAERARVVVGGIEEGEYVRNALARPFVRTSVNQIEQEVAACVAQLRIESPEIAILLFECTGFPCVTDVLRHKTGLPIYDITDLCRLTLAAIAKPALP